MEEQVSRSDVEDSDTSFVDSEGDDEAKGVGAEDLFFRSRGDRRW